MSAEAARAVGRLDGGEHLPTVEVAAFTRERVERVMLVSVGSGCAAIGAQAFFVALSDDSVHQPWCVGLLLLAFVPLALMVASSLFGRFVRTASIGFMAAFTLVLVEWPLATLGATETATQPWVYYLLNVATVAAVLVLRMSLQIVVTIGIPVLYAAVRLAELGFAPAAWLSAGLDVLYALILGSVLLTLAWMFRSAASDLDERRVSAVSSYARAAGVAASERERVAVAALMHDSVLAALIAAARADTPREQDLAVTMAREALTRLANTERDSSEGSDAPVGVRTLIDSLASALPPGVTVASVRRGDGPLVPGRVARALVLAATQAISNAVAHADAVGLRVEVVSRSWPASVTVNVSDRGPGFDMDAVPADRLGIRASIIARVTAFGGRAMIDTGPNGTTVTLEWREGGA
ncbi:MAG: ATP-binding protein [Microbacterium sp.]